MDDGKMSLNALNSLQRAKDVKRVHDSTRKQKKENRETDDGREFVDFLEDNEKVIDGFNEFVPEEPLVQAPSNKMLELLSTHAGPPLVIEPLDESADPPEQKPDAPGPDRDPRDEE